ncbi:hypothetical protein SLS57_005419 [Botryosphaeria dothidea]
MASSPSIPSSLPILDLSQADDPAQRPALLAQLHDALFNIGFLYIRNHGVDKSTITHLTEKLPSLFDLPTDVKAGLSKLNSPHFLGYSGFAEETTLGKKDLREQFDFATELPVVHHDPKSPDAQVNGKNTHSPRDESRDLSRDFSNLYWRLRGPNQWPPEDHLPNFRQALTAYHDAVQALSYRFVHLVEEAFGIPTGTFDHFFRGPDHRAPGTVATAANGTNINASYLPPQHRIKLLKYPPTPAAEAGQGVGAHKDSSGWLTFLLQIGHEAGLEVLSAADTWIPAPPIDGTFVVNFGNAFEAATEGAVRATVHCVKAPASTSPPRYSIPFFQGLPLDMTVSQIRSYIPESVRRLRRESDAAAAGGNVVSTFLDPRWDALGESQLRKWIRSHEDVGRKWYGDEVVSYYLS